MQNKELETFDTTVVEVEKDKLVEKPKKITLDEIIKKNQSSIKALGQMPEQVKTNLLQVLVRNPELKKASPETVLLGVAQAMQANVSLNPEDGECALIPRKTGINQVQAHIMYQYKAYSRVLKRDVNGVLDVLVAPVKDGDISEWDYATGEGIYSDEIFTSNFAKQQERRKIPNIGYIAVILLDEKLFGAKNIMAFMSLQDIVEHKKQVASKTIITDHQYAKKTLIRKVFRDFKDVYKDKITPKTQAGLTPMNALLATDMSVNDGNEITYIENGNSKLAPKDE